MSTTITTVEQFQQVWSDFHKDAYGYRPRGPMPEWTLEQWDAEFHRLAAICKDNAEREAHEQAEAKVDFEFTIDRLIKTGAPDRATAIRWLHDAHGTDGDNEYLCFQWGLPYGYLREAA